MTLLYIILIANTQGNFIELIFRLLDLHTTFSVDLGQLADRTHLLYSEFAHNISHRSQLYRIFNSHFDIPL